MTDEYYSLEDVKKRLNISEDELRRMISEGEIRAFRINNEIKAKKEDVEKLKHTSSTQFSKEPQVSPPEGAGEQKSSDATVIDFETPPPKETEPISKDTTISSIPQEEIKPAQAQGLGLAEEDTFVEEIDSGIETTPITKATEELGTTETVTREIPQAAPSGEIKKFSHEKPKKEKKSRKDYEASPALELEIERRRPSPIWGWITFFAFGACFILFIFQFDLQRQESGISDTPIKLTGDIAEWHLSKHCYNDPMWTSKIRKLYPELIPAEMEYVKKRYNKPTFYEPDDPLPEIKGEEVPSR